ncbi:MAG: hypothetical protein D6748_15480 [Calditrichaeota bacterium]|nr:MAG: hypothetical protein D6748_15480 [Calditrichota bacterium]
MICVPLLYTCLLISMTTTVPQYYTAEGLYTKTVHISLDYRHNFIKNNTLQKIHEKQWQSDSDQIFLPSRKIISYLRELRGI